MVNIAVLDEFPASDHRLVAATLRGIGNSKQRQGRRGTGKQCDRREWDEHVDEISYHEALDEMLEDAWPCNVGKLSAHVVEVAIWCAGRQSQEKGTEPEHIRRLREMRRWAASQEDRDSISKSLLRELGKQKRDKREAKLQAVLDRGGCKRELLELKQGPRIRKRVSAALGSHGKVHSNVADIAEVFATFYERLYSSGRQQRASRQYHGQTHLPEVTEEELENLLKLMKKKKACAEDGLIAEMLQWGSISLLRCIAAILTDILQGTQHYPDDDEEGGPQDAEELSTDSDSSGHE